MKKNRLLPLPAWTLLVCTLPLLLTSGFAQSQRLKVMTYNIHHCNPPSLQEGKIDVEAIAAVILKEKPHLVALQEVDVNTERSGKGRNQAMELGKLTGMHFYFAKAIDHQGGDYGVAVLSRFPVIDSLRIPLPAAPDASGEARVAAAVKVRLPSGKAFWFASTHLDLKEENRLKQSELLVQHLGSLKEPVVLGGDFNATPDSKVIRFLDTHFTRTCQDCKPTIPVETPRKAIDFLMIRPQSAFSLHNTRVIDEKYASDHLPVTAGLTVR